MKRFSKLLAVILAVVMILPGVVEAVSVTEDLVITRISGSGRVETSVEASKIAFKNGEATNVVLAGYSGEVDALAGTLLAKDKNAPLILTKANVVPEIVKKELKRLGAKNIYILGGERVVSKAVLEDLEKDYTVTRIAGLNREKTAINVAKKVSGKTNHVFLAKGYDVIADALAAGPVSAIENMPILLTRTNKLAEETLEAMKMLEVTHVTIVGGETAVSKAVVDQLKAYKVNRVEGANRESTALKIANEYFINPKDVIVANGYVSADALVGGYLGAMKDAPILLSNVNKITHDTINYLGDGIKHTYILGGTSAVSENVFNEVEEVIKDKDINLLAKQQLEINLEYMYQNLENPSFGTGGGEWSILSLARGGYDVPEDYYNLYYDNVVKKVKELMEKNNAKLHRAKGTEHSRLMLGLGAIGRDIRDVGGYDISQALADFNYVTRQGINGPIFALIALDTHGYEIPIIDGIKEQSTREMFIDYILEREIKQETGEITGWALTGNNPDPDITAMAIQGLTPYYETNKNVKVAIDRGIEWLSQAQIKDGGYSSWGSENVESASQVVVALTGLGIDPHTDSRFVKDGNSVIDNILTFAVEDGGFMHVKPGGNTGGGAAAGKVDGMATDQGTYALVAYDRFVNNQNRLYDMGDVNNLKFQ